MAHTQPAAPTCLPATSLIIASRNRPALLAETIESILRGDEVPTELIIVDQSDEAHRGLAELRTERCDLRYLWTRSVGLSRANNAGIAAARADVLVFTHDDVRVDPAWFGTLVRALRAAGPRGVVTGQVRPAAAEQPGGFAPSTIVADQPAVYEGRIDADVLYPLNMAFYRSAVAEVGEFDVRLGPGTPYPGAEDNDLGFRLLEAGYRIVYVPEAVVYHRAWRSSRDYLPLRWSYGRAQGAFFAKHLRLRDRHMLGRLTGTAGRHLRGFAGGVLRRRRRSLGDGVYLLGLAAGTAQWLLTRRRHR